MNIHEAYNTLSDADSTLDELLKAHKTFAAERGYLLCIAVRESGNDMQIEPKLWKLLKAEADTEIKIKSKCNQL